MKQHGAGKDDAERTFRPAVEGPWSLSAEQVLQRLDVTLENGLSPAEAKRRLKHYGPNRLRESRRRSAWIILADQFRNVIVLLLATATVLSFSFGEIVEGVAIAVVIAINALIGFAMELRATRSMEALRKLGRVETTVRRGGAVSRIPAGRLVPGDIVLFDGGDVIAADLRVVEASRLQANESVLTGESVPVGKRPDVADGDAPLAERSNMLFKGTAVTRGSGAGVVVGTGMHTELGAISSLVEEVEKEAAPLQERLDRLGKRLVWVTLAIVAVVAAAGIAAGREVLLIIETAIALAVATVPEGLPIVATIALARGMWRMARRNALVEQLSAVETLGSTNVILTDKTGTLTENRMTVVRIVLNEGEIEVDGGTDEPEGRFMLNGEPVRPDERDTLRRALEVGVLCNNASLRPEGGKGKGEDRPGGLGDPMEVALLAAGAMGGISREALLERMPEEREEAFDPEVKMMATFHRRNGDYLVAVKGAPEAVLQACSRICTESGERQLGDDLRAQWLDRNSRLAEEGFRLVAAAARTAADTGRNPYQDLALLGLIGLLDPPREEIRESIRACHTAGIRVVMVTGDQAPTARAVASAVGLVEDEGRGMDVVSGRSLKRREEMSGAEADRMAGSLIFARTSPAQKLDLIALHQDRGSIVTMIGDGVNDAPALKRADIGVAMGQRGTQVARQAADMILRDDAFSTIVAAVEQGRIIFDNIRKFVLYLLSCNVSEIMVVGIASVVNAPLPILPLQILFLNLVTDVFPALALGAGEGDPAIMRRPPRNPQEPVLTRSHWCSIALYGLLITGSVLGAFWMALRWLGMETPGAVTVSFLTLALAQLWHVFNMRDRESGILGNEVTANRWVWGALLLCIGLILAAIAVPGLSTVLEVVAPAPRGWAVVVGMSLAPLIIGQMLKILGVKYA